LTIARRKAASLLARDHRQTKHASTKTYTPAAMNRPPPSRRQQPHFIEKPFTIVSTPAEHL
jgi:hypothetical protein